MRTINIHLNNKQQKYSIIIDPSIIKKLSSLIDFTRYSTVVVLTDDHIEKLWLKKVQDAIPVSTQTIIIPYGEKNKTIQSTEVIWKKLHEYGCDRKSLLINLGGGVICDIGGFAASTYMRGIDFLQVPTTLLAAVDASVGGKTGFDFDGVKNLIGTIRHPINVLIDVDVLKTLPQRQLLNGFAEAIKHGLILDKDYFELVTSKNAEAFSEKERIDIICGSCEIKTRIIISDEAEKGQRKLINFGHTLGHAFEALSWETDSPLLHGEAVHVGMIAETYISNKVGLLSDKEATIIKEKLQHTGLPVAVKGMKTNDVIKKIASDKKKVKGQINWTLLKHIGEAVYDQQVDEQIVRQVLNEIIS